MPNIFKNLSSQTSNFSIAITFLFLSNLWSDPLNGWNFVLEKKLPRLSVNYVLNFVFGNRFEKLRRKSKQTLKIFFLKNKTIFLDFDFLLSTWTRLGYKTPSQILEDSHHLLWKLANHYIFYADVTTVVVHVYLKKRMSEAIETDQPPGM